MRVKIVAITSAAILVLSLFSYATTTEADCCRKKSNFWYAMASQGLNAGVDAFVTEESSMYAIRGYMQQNPVLAATEGDKIMKTFALGLGASCIKNTLE